MKTSLESTSPSRPAPPAAPAPARLRVSPRAGWLLPLGVALIVLPGAPGGVAAAESVDQALGRLRSGSGLERSRAEADLLRSGSDALPRVLQELGSTDRSYRFRAERVFLGLLDGLLAELEAEQTSVLLDRTELAQLRERKEAAELREEVTARYEAWKKEDPSLPEKLEQTLELERLELRETRATRGQAPPLPQTIREDLTRLRALRDEWRKQRPDWDAAIAPLLRQAKLQGIGVQGGALTELEAMRLKELEERLQDREPRLKSLEEKVLALGFPALNGLLARAPSSREKVAERSLALVQRFLESARSGLVDGAAATPFVGYERGLLWALEVDSGGPRAAEAQPALERHLGLVVEDLRDGENLIRDRAADELYLLGARGLESLKKTNDSTQAFLASLLRWRIRPRAYERTGMSFSGYERLGYREKRRHIFEYARAAEVDALPTLRAIVLDDSLEKSFNLKLAAAKAMAGLRDMSGFNILIVQHPDLTLKKPEVSRELLIIQGNEHIRDKDYAGAVEDLQRVLDELPFDFQANYYIAFAYLLLKNYAKAIHHFEIARRVSPKDELTLYNLACAYALAGNKSDSALEALEGAAEAGFDDYEHMERDPDLDSLKELPRYRALIDRLKGKTEEPSSEAEGRQ